MVFSKHELLVQARMNIYYHEKLEKNFSNWINWTAFFSLILSSTAFIALGNLLPVDLQKFNNLIVGILAFIVACLNGGILSFSMLDKMIKHADFRQRWVKYYGELQVIDEDNLERMNYMHMEFANITKDEPAPNIERLKKAQKMAENSFS